MANFRFEFVNDMLTALLLCGVEYCVLFNLTVFVVGVILNVLYCYFVLCDVIY